MCEICKKTPCDPRCPNAPEPEPVKICALCGEGIYKGERYYGGSEDGPVCEDCLQSMTAEQILTMFGEKLETAE